MIAYAEADIEVNSTPKIVIHNSNSVILNEFEITGNDITSVLKKSFAYCNDNAGLNNVLTIKIPEGKYLIKKTNVASSNTILDLTDNVVIYNACPRRGNIINSPNGFYGYDGLKNFTVRDRKAHV